MLHCGRQRVFKDMWWFCYFVDVTHCNNLCQDYLINDQCTTEEVLQNILALLVVYLFIYFYITVRYKFTATRWRIRHNITLLWFVKIYVRNLKKLQFTTNVSTLRSSVFIRGDLSAVTCFLLCSTLHGRWHHRLMRYKYKHLAIIHRRHDSKESGRCLCRPSFQTTSLMVTSIGCDNFRVIPRNRVICLARMLQQSRIILFWMGNWFLVLF